MRFVDYNVIDLQRRKCGNEVGVRRESLRGGEDELGAAFDPGERRVGFALRQCAVQLSCVNAERVQLVVLILHQRDQRRDHDRGAVQVKSRQLVAQRLAGSCRHDGERVAAAQDGADDHFLPRPERVQPKHASQRAFQVLSGGGHEA